MASSSNIPIYLQKNILHLNPSTLPIWNANTIYIDSKELYDLEIYSDDGHIDVEKDIDDILNINVSKCHICNIFVPNSYIQEHLVSAKHKIFSKIANIALKRTQNYMTTEMFSKMDKVKMEVKETYFCDICAAVVKNADKEKHATSDEHQNNEKNDKFIQQLVDIYEEPQKCFETADITINDIKQNENNIKEVLKITDQESEGTSVAPNKKKDNNKDIKDTKIHNSKLKLNEQLTNNNQVETANAKDSQNIAKTKEEEPKPSTSGSKNEKTTQFEENLVELKQYLHVAKYIHNDTVYPTAISEVTVELVGAQVDRVKVPLENFHGYRATGKTVVCKLCPGIESVDGKKHKWTDLHMKNVMLPLTKQYLRRLPNSALHCLLCNTIFTSLVSTDHLSSIAHGENANKYLTTVGSLTAKNKQIAFANNIKLKPDWISCRFCQFQSKKCNESLNNHVISTNHVKKLDAFLTANKISKMSIENGCYWCGVCQKKIGVYLAGHCVSFDHRRNLKVFDSGVPGV